MSYEHLIAAAAAQKIANPEVPLTAYGVGFSQSHNANTTHTSLCLSNLPFALSEDDIGRLFDQVTNVTILRNRETNRPRGMAIVQFSDAAHCNIAYDLCQSQQFEVNGRIIRGDYNRNERNNQPRDNSFSHQHKNTNETHASQWGDDRNKPSRGFQDRSDINQGERRSRFENSNYSAAPPGQQSYGRGYEDRGFSGRDGNSRGGRDGNFRGGRGGFQPRGGYNDNRGGGFHDRKPFQSDRGEQRYDGEQRGGYNDQRAGGSGFQGDSREYQQDGRDGNRFQDSRGDYQDFSQRRGGGGRYNEMQNDRREYYEERRGGGGFQGRGGGRFNDGDRSSRGGYPPRGDFRGGGFRGGRGRGSGRDRSVEGGPRPSKYGFTSACMLPTSGRPTRQSSSSSGSAN